MSTRERILSIIHGNSTVHNGFTEDGKLRSELLSYLSEINADNVTLELPVFTLLYSALNKCTTLFMTGTSDFEAVRKIFILGSVHCLLCEVKFRQLYFKCSSWSNINFWIDSCISQLLENNLLLKQLDRSAYLRSFPSEISQSIITLCTIQSFVSSMLMVGLTGDHVETFLSKMSDKLNMIKCNIDIHQQPSKIFTPNLLKSLLADIIPHAVAKAKGKPHHGSKSKEPMRIYENSHRSSSAQQVVANGDRIGYSPLVELLFTVKNTSDDFTRKPSAALNDDPSAVLSKIKVECICGKTIEKWKIVGADLLTSTTLFNDVDSLDSRQSTQQHAWTDLAHVMCEKCYRCLFTKDYMTLNPDTLFLSTVCPAMYSNIDEDGEQQSAGDSESDEGGKTFETIFYGRNNNFSSDSLEGNSARGAVNCKLLCTNVSDFLRNKSRPLPAVPLQSPSSAASSNNTSFSQQPPVTSPSAATSSTTQSLQEFVAHLWRGYTIKVIYAGKPAIEKTRILYLRTGDEKFDNRIGSTLSTENASVLLNQKMLYLCWAHRSDRSNLLYIVGKSVAVDTIKHIKVGAGKWKQCINIASESNIPAVTMLGSSDAQEDYNSAAGGGGAAGGNKITLVVKVEEEDLFQIMLDGLLALVASRNTRNK